MTIEQQIANAVWGKQVPAGATEFIKIDANAAHAIAKLLAPVLAAAKSQALTEVAHELAQGVEVLESMAVEQDQYPALCAQREQTVGTIQLLRERAAAIAPAAPAGDTETTPAPRSTRIDAASRACIAEWNRVEPGLPVSPSYVASYVDATRAALVASDEVTLSDESLDAAAFELFKEDHWGQPTEWPTGPFADGMTLAEFKADYLRPARAVLTAALKDNHHG